MMDATYQIRFVLTSLCRTTAYGSIEKIPGGVDILVAGTSCVDFSCLNNKKEEQKKTGESAATLKGLLDYAKLHRPRIVVVENVKTADWEAGYELFDSIGYEFKHRTVDTKAYYMPQTRQRGYAVAVDRQYVWRVKGAVPKKVVGAAIDLLAQFERRCSSPASSFLIDTLDLTYERIETDVCTRAGEKTRKDATWDQYQKRHRRCRETDELGEERPISRTVLHDVSQSKWPEFYDHRWAKLQVERVIDTIDMKHLKGIIRGYDSRFKERYQDNSQGVDRGSEGPNSFGVLSCVTPSGLLFGSHVGRPLYGFDALVMQGMPVERIMLGGEKERELQNLAGNAMTTTVVAAVMLSTLIACKDLLGSHDDAMTDITNLDITNLGAAQKAQCGQLIGIVDSSESEKQTEYCEELSSAILEQASKAARHCYCESQTRTAKNILACNDCGDTICHFCSGNPEHNHSPVPDATRKHPREFVKMLKRALPMRLTTGNIPEGFFVPKSPGVANSEHFAKISEEYYKIVNGVNKAEFFFTDIKRSEIWTICYESEQFSLHLELEDHKAKWFLYAKTPKHHARNSVLRAAFAKPIAKLSLTDKDTILPTFGDAWEAIEPISDSFKVNISFGGTEVPSYGARCGIKQANVIKPHAWSEIYVSINATDSEKLEYDLSGTYLHLPKCGTSYDNLYKKEGTKGQPTIFLFHDPGKLSNPQEDSYVFSLEHRRIPGCDERRTLAELDSSWNAEGPQSLDDIDSEPSGDEHVEASDDEGLEFMDDEDPKPKKGQANLKRKVGEAASTSKTGKSASTNKRQKGTSTAKGRKRASPKKKVQVAKNKSKREASPAKEEGTASKNKGKKVASKSTEEVIQESTERKTESTVGWVRRSHKANEIQHNNTAGGSLCLNPVADNAVCFQVLNPSSQLTLGSTTCHFSHTPLLQLTIPSSLLNFGKATSQYTAIESHKIPAIVQKISWALQGCGYLSAFESWRSLTLTTLATPSTLPTGIPPPDKICQNCNPPRPSFIWKKNQNNRLQPCEHPQEAATWERLTKQQPPPFKLFLRNQNNTDSKVELIFTINLQSLAHIAYGNLTKMDSDAVPKMTWRALQDTHDAGRQPHPDLQLHDTRDEVEADKPPNFLVDLHPQQRRSLTWLKKQESDDIQPWVENEVVEAALPEAGWRAEVGVSAPNTIRGGLIADEVGYGKTACILGLFDSQYKKDKERAHAPENKFAKTGQLEVHATLVILPTPLVNQWKEEATKFLGNKYNVLVLRSIREFEKCTIQSILDADLILAGKSILTADKYFDKLSLFTGCAEMPSVTKDGNATTAKDRRLTEEWLEDALVGLMEVLRIGSEKGVEAWMEKALANHREMDQLIADSTYIPSQRLRGAKFAENARETAQKDEPEHGDDPMDVDNSKPEEETETQVQTQGKPKHKNLELAIKCFISADNPTFKTLKAAFLHGFSFSRVVADEFQLLEEEEQMILQKIPARSRWIVSGSAVVQEFADVRTIAKHINAHLGIDNDGDIPTQNKRLTKMRETFTPAEQFLKYQPPCSDEWYQNRHKLAQSFLDRFARKNAAEYKGRTVESLRSVELKASQAYLYFQVLLHWLKPDDRQEYNSDTKDFRQLATRNIIQAIEMGPPDSLSRACTSYRTRERMFDSALLTEAIRVRAEEESLCDDLFAEFLYHKRLLRGCSSWESFYDRMNESLHEALAAVGDAVVTEELTRSYNAVGTPWLRSQGLKRELEEKCNSRMAKAYPKESRVEGGVMKYQGDYDEADIRPLCRELRKDLEERVTLFLAAFWNCRKYQRAEEMEQEKTLNCDLCESEFESTNLRLLYDCGHILCKNCYKECGIIADGDDEGYESDDEDNPYDPSDPYFQCAVGPCQAKFQYRSTIRGSLLAISNMPKKCTKLQEMLNILHGIPKTDQAIIFIQQPDIMNLIAAILEKNKFTFSVGRSNEKNAIPSFTKKRADDEIPKKQILLLQLGSEMGAGL